MKRVYMDHAATTPTDPQVLKAMTPYFTEVYGNPSSVYSLSRGSREAICLLYTSDAADEL